MQLGLILLLSLFTYILMPSIYNPAIFLGILAVYILARQYLLFGIWLITIILVLSSFSLTSWWQLGINYILWSIGVYMSSVFLDKSWAIQSIIATLWLMFCKFIITGFSIDYMNLIIYTIFNGLAIAICLYIAEKLKIYE
jgi:hypothetical protein